MWGDVCAELADVNDEEGAPATNLDEWAGVLAGHTEEVPNLPDVSAGVLFELSARGKGIAKKRGRPRKRPLESLDDVGGLPIQGANVNVALAVPTQGQEEAVLHP
eukprot:6054523-Amphidinium_carterae.1